MRTPELYDSRTPSEPRSVALDSITVDVAVDLRFSIRVSVSFSLDRATVHSLVERVYVGVTFNSVAIHVSVKLWFCISVGLSLDSIATGIVVDLGLSVRDALFW